MSEPLCYRAIPVAYLDDKFQRRRPSADALILPRWPWMLRADWSEPATRSLSTGMTCSLQLSRARACRARYPPPTISGSSMRSQFMLCFSPYLKEPQGFLDIQDAHDPCDQIPARTLGSTSTPGTRLAHHREVSRNLASDASGRRRSSLPRNTDQKRMPFQQYPSTRHLVFLRAGLSTSSTIRQDSVHPAARTLSPLFVTARCRASLIARSHTPDGVWSKQWVCARDEVLGT